MGGESMDEIKRYTDGEWAEREKSYTGQLEAINLPEQPSTADLLRILAQLDRLYCQARLELCHWKRRGEWVELQYRREYTKAYCEVREQGKTEKDREVLVNQQLAKVQIEGRPADEARYIAEHRLWFMETMIDILRRKYDLVGVTARSIHGQISF
ncbi:MAG: hypothetical protein ACM3ZQ_05080, partial [Bacillota bacterium]